MQTCVVCFPMQAGASAGYLLGYDNGVMGGMCNMRIITFIYHVFKNHTLSL